MFFLWRKSGFEIIEALLVLESNVIALRSLRASVEVCNLGSGLDYGSGPYGQPALARASVAIKPLKGLLLTAGTDYLFSGALMAGTGLEYSIFDLVFIRAGFHYGDAAKAIPSYATVGLGLKLKGFSLDAVTLPGGFSPVCGTTMLRLGYEF